MTFMTETRSEPREPEREEAERAARAAELIQAYLTGHSGTVASLQLCVRPINRAIRR